MKRISKQKKQAIAAKEFALQWENHGNEKSDTQHFWTDLLQKVLLVSDPHSYIEFENLSDSRISIPLMDISFQHAS